MCYLSQVLEIICHFVLNHHWTNKSQVIPTPKMIPPRIPCTLQVILSYVWGVSSVSSGLFVLPCTLSYWIFGLLSLSILSTANESQSSRGMHLALPIAITCQTLGIGREENNIVSSFPTRGIRYNRGETKSVAGSFPLRVRLIIAIQFTAAVVVSDQPGEASAACTSICIYHTRFLFLYRASQVPTHSHPEAGLAHQRT